MSSYFSVINNDGITTIDDNNQTLGVCREGVIKANISSGEIYGFSVANGESVAFRPDRDTKMICSPPAIYSGNLVYFVATDGDASIKYRVYKKVSLSGLPLHGEGLALFDRQGKTVFDSSVSTWRHKGFYQSEFLYAGTGFDEKYLIMWHFMWLEYKKRMEIWDLNKGSQGNSPVSIISDMEIYINPVSSPWFTRPDHYVRADHGFSALGYIYKGKTVTTERYFDRWYVPTSILGIGDIETLSSCVGELNVQTGICSFSYMFNVVGQERVIT